MDRSVVNYVTDAARGKGEDKQASKEGFDATKKVLMTQMDMYTYNLFVILYCYVLCRYQ